MFDPIPIIKQLESNADLFNILLVNVKEEEARWKPSPKKWSIMEVLCHLIYEEGEDFPARLKYALENFRGELPMIDPEGFVTNADLSKAEFKTMLFYFKGKRRTNTSFLEYAASENPNWDNYLIHPELGKLSAKMFLTNWLVHDHLHIKQILSLRNEYLAHKTQQDISYAGGV